MNDLASFDRVEALRSDLLFSVALATGWLKPAEKIFAIRSAGLWNEVRARDRTDLLMAAGAYEEAIPDYAALHHWRKVGDACFAMGRLDEARQYYERGENVRGEDYMAWRGGPDHDRLIALALTREDWTEVLRLIRKAEPDPFGPSQVIFAGSNRAKGPLIKVSAHAAIAAGDVDMARDMRGYFGLAAKEVTVFLEHARSGAYAKDVLKFSNPPMLRVAPRTIGEILIEGATDRAKSAADFMTSLRDDFGEASSNFAAWYERRDEAALSRVVFWLTRSGSFEILKCCLASLSNEAGVYHGGGERLILFYTAHPWITRASMRELLRALVAGRTVPTPGVLLSCVLQNSASIISDIEKGIFDPHRSDPLTVMRGHPDWAESIIGECVMRGTVDPFWATLCAEAAQQPYADVRKGAAFSALCDYLADELQSAWKRDLDVVRWKSEESAYLALQSLLQGVSLARHAMPSWLAPQHLDIFLPEAGLAIEYQGEQHFRPIGIFGGEAGFEATARRDRNKARLCQLAGVRLEYIRFDDDVSVRLKDIAALARANMGQSDDAGKK